MLIAVKWNIRRASFICRERIAPSMSVNGAATDA
jgi:hypothetical protein